jgi:hypothetical protein
VKLLSPYDEKTIRECKKEEPKLVADRHKSHRLVVSILFLIVEALKARYLSCLLG